MFVPSTRSGEIPASVIDRLYSVAFAVALFFLPVLFYGCSTEKTGNFSEKPTDSAAVASADSEESDSSALSEDREADSDAETGAEPEAESSALSAAEGNTSEAVPNLENLTEVIDQFVGETGGAEGAEKTAGTEQKPDGEGPPEDVKKRLTRRSDVEFVPKIVDGVAADAPRYTLRYQFEPDSETRWNVSHRLWKETSYGGMTRNIETVSKIVRRWKIGRPDPADELERFPGAYFIDSMNLQQREEGAEPILYDSQTDETVPAEFAQFGTEKMIGVELENFRVDPYGLMTEKTKLIEGFRGEERNARVLVPFPDEPVAVGESWTLPYTIFLQNRDKTVKTLDGVKKYTLENVTGSLATIRFRTTLLSIVGDPFLEGQLAEKLFSATARFDMERGIMIQTEQEFKRTVPGAFGDGTILDYRCKITEELVR